MNKTRQDSPKRSEIRRSSLETIWIFTRRRRQRSNNCAMPVTYWSCFRG